MKVEIFDESKEEEKVLRLRLVEVGNSVRLWAVDKNGVRIDKGTLLSISSDGLERHLRINPEIGLPRDGNGRIKLNEGEPE